MSKIINLTEAASIGLHGMIIVAKGTGVTNVLTISELTGSSKHHVAKVMQRLVKEGFLDSQRGPNGGFSLKVKPEDLSLLDIYEAIEGKIVAVDCPLDKEICPFDKCMFSGVTKKMTNDFIEYLDKHTLRDYMS